MQTQDSNASAEKRSLNHAFNTMVALGKSTTGLHLKRRRFPTQLSPDETQPKKITLAVQEICPDFSVTIETLLIPKRVLDRRLNATKTSYEFLVEFQKVGAMHNRWMSTTEMRRYTKLVTAFDERKRQLLESKQHVDSWYPYRESHVVRWRETGYFVVPYGGGQWNLFCVVGLNREKKELKCKHIHGDVGGVHTVHIHLVRQYMQEAGLVIHNNGITARAEAEVNAAGIDNAGPSLRPVRKPISKTPIHLKPVARLQNNGSIPVEFKPAAPSSPCNCGCAYKKQPEVLPKRATLWTSEGPPRTNCNIFVWRCERQSTACDVFYDGATDGVFNFSNETLLTYELMFGLLFAFISGYVRLAV
jgi:hypothetical protein